MLNSYEISTNDDVAIFLEKITQHPNYRDNEQCQALIYELQEAYDKFLL